MLLAQLGKCSIGRSQNFAWVVNRLITFLAIPPQGGGGTVTLAILREKPVPSLLNQQTDIFSLPIPPKGYGHQPMQEMQ